MNRTAATQARVEPGQGKAPAPCGEACELSLYHFTFPVVGGPTGVCRRCNSCTNLTVKVSRCVLPSAQLIVTQLVEEGIRDFDPPWPKLRIAQKWIFADVQRLKHQDEAQAQNIEG